MSQFWTPASYFMLDKCSLSTNSFTLAQLSPFDQRRYANLGTIIGSVATILSCLQTGQADLSYVKANPSPLICQQNIFLAKFKRQSLLLAIVSRGLPAIVSGNYRNFLLLPDVVSGRASFSLADFKKRRYQN